MFVAGNFLWAVAQVLDIALWTYLWIVIIRAVISWVNPDPYNPIVRFLVAVTEPVLAPVRRLLPSYKLGLDLSPLVVILAIYFLNFFLVRTLVELSYRIR